jgi:hypothetical protein
MVDCEMLIRWARNKMNNYIAELVSAEVRKTTKDMVPLIKQLVDFSNSSKEEMQSYHDGTKNPYGNINLYASLRDRLEASGVSVKEVEIDIPDFERWLADFPEIKMNYQGIGEAFIEKCLEHCLAYRYLNISRDDVYIGIAAAGSPWADILNERGIKSYRLDLTYPLGIHGSNIGGDAGDSKLPVGFASVLSAQCAFECFMGNADFRFIREADRILDARGRYGIVPLYLDDTYFVATSPYCNQQDVIIESEAKKVWRDDEYKVPFSRHYSPESFRKRIYSVIPESMKGKVLFFSKFTGCYGPL